jgi:hypothetical protein
MMLDGACQAKDDGPARIWPQEILNSEETWPKPPSTRRDSHSPSAPHEQASCQKTKKRRKLKTSLAPKKTRRKTPHNWIYTKGTKLHNKSWEIQKTPQEKSYGESKKPLSPHRLRGEDKNRGRKA